MVQWEYYTRVRAFILYLGKTLDIVSKHVLYFIMSEQVLVLYVIFSKASQAASSFLFCEY